MSPKRWRSMLVAVWTIIGCVGEASADDSVQLWPIEAVVDNKYSFPDAFPHVNLEVMYYAISTCRSTPIQDYLFFNGTMKNATYGDMVDDMEPLYSDPKNVKGREAYANMTEQLALDLWYRANRTLSLINFTDLPPNSGGLLANGAAGKATGGKLKRRMDGAGATGIEMQPIGGSAAPAPADTAVAITEPTAVSSYSGGIMNVTILLGTSAVAMAFTYGFVELGARAPVLRDHADAVRFFGTFGLAVGLVSGYYILSIQKANRRWRESIANELRESLASEQITMRSTIRLLQNRLDRVENEARDLAAARGQSVPRAMAGAAAAPIVEPLAALATDAKNVVKKATDTLKRAGSSIGDLVGLRGSPSGPGSTTSAPGNVENVNNELLQTPDALLDIDRMESGLSEDSDRLSCSSSGGGLLNSLTPVVKVPSTLTEETASEMAAAQDETAKAGPSVQAADQGTVGQG